MIRNIIKKNANKMLVLSHKMLYGIFGIIYTKNAIIIKKDLENLNFHEVKKLSGNLPITVKGEELTGFKNNDVVYFTIRNDCIIFYKKDYDLSKPIPKLKKDMLRPKLIIDNSAMPDEDVLYCLSNTYDANRIHIDTNLHKRCLKSKEIDVTLRKKEDGSNYIELRDAELEYIPTISEYKEVYGKNLEPILQDGITYRVKKQGKKNCTLNVQLPPNFLANMGYTPSKKVENFPTWFDIDNRRIIIELPKVECGICGTEERSIQKHHTNDIFVCPDCVDKMGKGNSVNKLLGVIEDVTRISKAQNEILGSGEQENKPILERLSNIEKILGEIREITL